MCLFPSALAAEAAASSTQLSPPALFLSWVIIINLGFYNPRRFKALEKKMGHLWSELEMQRDMDLKVKCHLELKKTGGGRVLHIDQSRQYIGQGTQT